MKHLKIVAVVVLATFVAWVVIGRHSNQRSLLKNGKLINVKIVSWTSPSKGSSFGGVYCEFVYKEKKYHLHSPATIGWGIHHQVGRTFPAMFSEEKEIIEVLMTRKDFEKFNIPFPDSLQWLDPGD